MVYLTEASPPSCWGWLADPHLHGGGEARELVRGRADQAPVGSLPPALSSSVPSCKQYLLLVTLFVKWGNSTCLLDYRKL